MHEWTFALVSFLSFYQKVFNVEKTFYVLYEFMSLYNACTIKFTIKYEMPFLLSHKTFSASDCSNYIPRDLIAIANEICLASVANTLVYVLWRYIINKSDTNVKGQRKAGYKGLCAYAKTMTIFKHTIIFNLYYCNTGSTAIFVNILVSNINLRFQFIMTKHHDNVYTSNEILSFDFKREILLIEKLRIYLYYNVIAVNISLQNK